MVTSARAEDRSYAMAFIDMRMPPGWDGVETVERLWAIDPELQVALCTAFSDYSLEEMGRAARARRPAAYPQKTL
jgi:diguanylate cyclase